MRDGRVLNGLVKRQTASHAYAPDADRGDRPRAVRDRSLRPSPSSLMPDGLLDTLSATEIRDLIAYLSHPTQVPLPRGRGGGIRKPEQ